MQVYLTTERKTIEVFNFVDVSPTGRRRYFRVEGTAHLFISPGSETGGPVRFTWSMRLRVLKITDHQYMRGLDGIGWWYESFTGTEINIPTRRQDAERAVELAAAPDRLRGEELRSLEKMVQSLGAWIQKTYIRRRSDFREEEERRIHSQSPR